MNSRRGDGLYAEDGLQKSTTFGSNAGRLRALGISRDREGLYVTDPVVADTNATYTAGISERRGGASKFYHADRMGTNTAETDCFA